MGGSTKPQISTQQPKSQATPLAEDVLSLLRKQIEGGIQGVNPLQQESGTAARQFLNSGGIQATQFDFGEGFNANPFASLGLDFSGVPTSLSGVRDVSSMIPNIRDVGAGSVPGVRDVSGIPSVRDINTTRTDFGSVNTGGTAFNPLNFDFGGIRGVDTGLKQGVRDVQTDLGPSALRLENLIPIIAAASQQRTEQDVGNLRESMGIAGTRFGTALTKGESALRAQAGTDLNNIIAQLAVQLDASRRADAELKLRGQEAGVTRDVSINNILSQLLGLGVQRDTSAGQLNLGQQGLGLERDQAISQQNLGLRNLDLQKLIASSQEGLSLQDLAVRRDLGVGGLNLQGQELGINRDLGNVQNILQALELGQRGDIARGSQALEASGQGIQRDLGVQGNELGLSNLLSQIAQATGQFDLSKTQAGQGDQLARSQTQLGAQEFLNQFAQGNQGQLLNAIQLMNQIGVDSFAPILQMAMQGVLPEDTIVQDSKLKSILDPISGLLSGIGSIIPG